MKRYVQYGCGFSAPLEWINYDASPTLRFEQIPILGKLYTRNEGRFPKNVKYGNIITGLPEAPNSCDGIFCSHILEHLSYTDFFKAVNNTYSLLKPGGIFRCVVPDLKACAIRYLENYDHLPDPAHYFMKSTLLGKEKRSFIKDFLGNSKHLWMWDEKTLIYELEKIGFKNIRSCRAHDCQDAHFNFVEEKEKFTDSVAIECQR